MRVAAAPLQAVRRTSNLEGEYILTSLKRNNELLLRLPAVMFVRSGQLLPNALIQEFSSCHQKSKDLYVSNLAWRVGGI